ncbi:unnamed protein product [Phyllotreta striolata]|uniref:Proton-coupled folate transporter n=1 Tax=Phyllotreta striolata TaxID=444603 RepID=A0A9N9TJ96_PHYSR|nr:unnamed protein product [Phyllotreta striolata]
MGKYKITVEVPLALCYLSFQLVGGVLMNLNMYKTCYNILHYPESNCSKLGRDNDAATTNLEKIVQPYTGTLTTVSEMVPLALPIAISLMIGSWSDRYGRKPVLIVVLICQTLGFTISTVLLSFKELSPWWLMLGTIPMVVCGGTMTFFTVISSYLNDISTEHTRAMRMVVYEIVIISMKLLGGFSGSYIFYASNYLTIYIISTLLVATACAYTFFFCPESLKNISETRGSIKDLFSLVNFKELYEVAQKPREYYRKTIILLVVLTLVVLQFVIGGETNIKLLYLQNKLDWRLTQINTFGAVANVLVIVSSISCTYFLQKKLETKETILVVLSLLSSCGVNLFYAFATSDIYIYVSAIAGMFSGLANPMLRTIIAKLVDPEELGRIFSLITVITTIILLVSSLSYVQLYNATLRVHPETYNYLSLGLNSFAIVVVIYIAVLESRVGAAENSNDKIEVGEEIN